MNVLDHFAAILWYSAGAVIPWESAAPQVQDRYREKARALARAALTPASTASQQTEEDNQ